jgi:IS30 family transposase
MAAEHVNLPIRSVVEALNETKKSQSGIARLIDQARSTAKFE